MHRTHTCGELRITDTGKTVTLAGWVQRKRDKGGLIWIDVRDRYGLTQIVMEEGVTPPEIINTAHTLGREFVIKVKGLVIERSNKNPNMPTGDIEIRPESIEILNTSKLPPFTIEDDTDGGEELRMKYRYLDLRRNPVRKNLELRHRMAAETRKYLDQQGFLEIETPVLIKSTP
jgi:aspartyl-tRNA synthetase